MTSPGLNKREWWALEDDGLRARGMVSSRSSGRRVSVQRFSIEGELGVSVEALWFGRWDLPQDRPHTTELLGDPCVHFVFERSRDVGGEVRQDARVVGVWSKRWVRTLERSGAVVGIKLRAGASALWLKGSAHLLRDRIAPLSELFDDVRDLERDIWASASTSDVRVLIEEWLTNQRRSEFESEAELCIKLMHRALEDREISTVVELAEVAGFDVRTLQQWFRKYVGVSPKWVLLRRRVQDAIALLETGGHSLAEAASSLGYSDHAHLSRDFKRMTGLSPSAFLQVD